MASVNKPAYRAAKSSRGRPLNIVLGALLSCSVIAGSAWGLASALSTMHEAARTISEGPVGLRLAAADMRSLQPVPKAIKSARMQKPSESEIRRDELTAEAVLKAHQRGLDNARLALAEMRKKAEDARILTAFARVESAARREQTINGKPSLMTALVEDVPVQELQPFNLVLSNEETDEALALPEQVPLPGTKPLIGPQRADPKPAAPKPADDKPLLGRAPERIQDVAIAKPGRSLFGDLFKRKTSVGGWSGNRNRVAIYDVSAATVYLPDGTKLRAHSGIGHMRDNPRYEHVTMKGPTPAGIYRLSMREARFYGVEAIRMTSIDGRDPKNRTGLLTHTNLLRGQIGSHGCVAFQDYQPFLKAFKRGQISTLVVVPQLPSSDTQLAALYRKAGA